MTFAEAGRIEHELDRLARRHSWFDTSIDDILPDICHIMMANKRGYRYALHELLKLWINGERYAAAHPQRQSATQEMTNIVIRDWVVKHHRWTAARSAIRRAKQESQGRTDDGDTSSRERGNTRRDASGTGGQTGGSYSAPTSIKDIKDAYDILGVSATASLEDVKAAYRKNAKEWHPDKLESMAEELRAFATKRVALINSAYSLILERRSQSRC
jgi:DnaJ-domain-containing protein 1